MRPLRDDEPVRLGGSLEDAQVDAISEPSAKCCGRLILREPMCDDCPHRRKPTE